MSRFLVVGLILGLFGQIAATSSWLTALTSNIDDGTFYYNSPVWFNSTPFNTQSSTTKNALFSSYSTIYVQKIRITMDGTTDKSCGTRCIFTFSIPESYSGKFTLKDLVTLEGGLEISDDRGILWVNLFSPLLQFNNIIHRKILIRIIFGSKAPSRITSTSKSKNIFLCVLIRAVFTPMKWHLIMRIMIVLLIDMRYNLCFINRSSSSIYYRSDHVHASV